VDLMGIKCVALDSLSATTIIESCYLDVVSNSIIRSIVTTSISILEFEKIAINPLGVQP
jgi:hypothetical protein